MKLNTPQHLLPLALAVALLALSSCSNGAGPKVLKINISPNITHIAANQTIRLAAYRQYQPGANNGDVASAAPPQEAQQSPVQARWSISDSSLASISEDGTVTALKPGRLTVKSAWEDYEATTEIEVVKNLPASYLPQLSVRSGVCQPKAIALSLSAERMLSFRLSFNNGACDELFLETKAPEQSLPWKFELPGGTLEVTSARGHTVSGEARMNGKGDVSFSAWSGGAGLYPLALANKTVLLIGDSMAEGIGPFLRKKVEAAGGRFVGLPWCSSTTVGWLDSGRITEDLAQYKPDIVFIALGSNEIFIKNPDERAPVIKKIVAQLGNRPAYWVGPPSWKPDSGIVRVIEENFQPDHFYNSNDLKVERRKDGAHPKVEGYAYWTELIWDWYAQVG
jgi:lysophospholipase L1-like esterase